MPTLRYDPHPGVVMVRSWIEKGDRITHRIAITSVDQIDDTVARWLRRAYDLDA